MTDFEKLGSFYLGRLFDRERNATSADLLLYDSKDLTTHAVVVGMTGSGKTGLGITLLEEAAIDGIPAIVIDPKGDLANLLLTFPRLEPADFRPWIDESAAARKSMTPDAFAAETAETWRTGLAAWGQDGARIERLRAAAETAIYTPGSSAGLPITVLRSFEAPPGALLEDADLYRDRITASASGLMALLGIEGDPIQSREHILISNILDNAWRGGRSLELASLIAEIQSPPFEKVGVMNVDTFYPPKDRIALSLRLNNLLASPSFAGWLEGETLDINRLLYTAEGKPRLAILSIAHLPEAERMFFVTILLNEILAWIRTQPGTSSLRALLYMDEVFGYFPPVAEPPAKRPMLTLLKQARAYGLGVVLATQNPVDLDYKGLSNTGTWFLGRLQTERDKERVLEGLEGASAAAGKGFDRGRMEAILAGLKSRVFLMNNVHDDAPVLFETRWALSYLAGPITRKQISTLTIPAKAGMVREGRVAGKSEKSATVSAAVKAPAVTPAQSSPPVLPPSVKERFLHPEKTDEGTTYEGTLYRPSLQATARLHYVRAGVNVDTWTTLTVRAGLAEGTTSSPWDEADITEGELGALSLEPAPGATRGELPAAALEEKNYAVWSKKLADHLYRTRPLVLWSCPELKDMSKPGESERDFRIRLGLKSHEIRDDARFRLERAYGPKLQRLRDKIADADQTIDLQQSQYDQQKTQTAISVGATLLGAVFGRKLVGARNVGRATTAARGMSRAARERQDVVSAMERREMLQRDLEALEAQFNAEVAGMNAPANASTLVLEEVTIPPRKADITVSEIDLLWTAWRRNSSGMLEPLPLQP